MVPPTIGHIAAGGGPSIGRRIVAVRPMRQRQPTPHADPMITTTALTKRYDGTAVVRDVSLHCEPGTITGFLGANGAGKSTTLKMIAGLVRPDHGTATVDGLPFVDLPNPTRVVGMLLDPSAMHPGRSGRATLTIAARLAGVPTTRVDHLLDLVGIAESADKRVGTYSLGMRQRLGVAQALVGDPRALILDEPANGLDPEGIAWMRTLLRDFADRGGTVLLSSHLLHEVQATADHLVVIAGGAVVTAGRLDDLLASATIVVRSPDRSALAAALVVERIDHSSGPGDAFTVDAAGGRVTTEVLAAVARDHRVLLTELRPSETNELEQLFFSLTAAEPAPTQEVAR
jgi:ABC-2 type transport system ATP-binding protein